MLVMGEPGAGKTLLAGTSAEVPELMPLLYLDVDGGVVTNAQYEDIDARPITGIKQLETIYDVLDKNRGYYKTVVVDSLSELQKLDMKDIMAEAKKKHPDTTDEEVPDQRAYLKSQVHIRNIVRAYRDLGLHVIFITHSKVEDKAGKIKILPQLPGQQAAEIAGFLSIVGLLEVERVRVKNPETDKTEIRVIRQLTTASDGISVVKDRTRTLPPILKQPTMTIIYNYIQSHEIHEGK